MPELAPARTGDLFIDSIDDAGISGALMVLGGADHGFRLERRPPCKGTGTPC